MSKTDKTSYKRTPIFQARTMGVTNFSLHIYSITPSVLQACSRLAFILT